MFKDKKRARRRHHRARMVARAFRMARAWDWSIETPQRMADNMAKCSCWMCGNPRKWGGEPLMAERRQAIRERDWNF
jgi:hypothetical protein